MRPISKLELYSVLARLQTQHGLRSPAAEMPVIVIHRDGLLLTRLLLAIGREH